MSEPAESAAKSPKVHEGWWRDISLEWRITVTAAGLTGKVRMVECVGPSFPPFGLIATPYGDTSDGKVSRVVARLTLTDGSQQLGYIEIPKTDDEGTKGGDEEIESAVDIEATFVSAEITDAQIIQWAVRMTNCDLTQTPVIGLPVGATIVSYGK